MQKLLRRISHYTKILLVVLFIIIEELTWKKIGEPVYRRIRALRMMRKFKTWIANVEHRYALLGIFLSVFLLMEITSTIGLILIGTGAIFIGVVFYSMKVLLTVPAVVIFNAGKKQLLSFWLIRSVFILIIQMKRSKIFRAAKAQLRQFKESIVLLKNKYFKSDKKRSFIASIKTIYRDMRKK